MQNLAAGELLLGCNLGLLSGAKKPLVSGRVMSTHPVEILARRPFGASSVKRSW